MEHPGATSNEEQAASACSLILDAMHPGVWLPITVRQHGSSLFVRKNHVSQQVPTNNDFCTPT